MKKQFYSLASKLALAVMMAFSTLTAMADNRLVLGDGGNIMIKPGETKEIPVTIECDNDFQSLQLDFDFTTDKLEVVENTFRVNTDVVPNSDFMVYCVQQPDGYYRITMLASGLNKSIKAGTKDTFAYLTIKASDSFTGKNSDNSEDYASSNVGVVYKNGVATGQKGKENYWFVDTYTHVVPNVGSLSATEDAFSIKPGATHKVEFVLNNEIDMLGIDGRIMLPEGLSIEKNADDEYVFTQGERLQTSYNVYSRDYKDGGVNFIVSGMTATPIGGEKGEVLFSFNVIADKSFNTTDESYITVYEPTASSLTSTNYDLENLVRIKVTSTLAADHEALMARIDSAMQVALATATAADEKLNSDYKDVKEAYDDTLAELTSKINKIGVEANAQLATFALTEENTQAYVDSLTDIKNQIDSLIAEATEMHDKLAADEKAAKDNQDAYDRLKAELDEVQKSLDSTIATIESDYAEVASQFVGVEAAIQQELDRLYRELEQAYKNQELGEDSSLDIQYLKDQIAKLIEDAKKAVELGIEGIMNVNGVDCTAIYSLDGKKLDTPARGKVNVLKYADGTVRKIFIK